VIQFSQALLPITFLYLPAPHCTHDPVDPVHPALHSQSVCSLLPAGETEFAGQLTQLPWAWAPTPLEYLPAIQSAQTDAPVPVERTGKIKVNAVSRGEA